MGITTVCGQCLDSQRSLSLQLKEDLKFNSSESKKLVNWSQNREDCCEWGGVACHTSSGSVIGLELDGEGIYAGINTSTALYKFHLLQKLNLANNDFGSTEIPYRLFNLTSLTYLNLSNCGFASQIPLGISRFTRLKILDLSTSFNLYADSVLEIENPNLRMILQDLKELTELYLDGVNMTAQANSWSQDISSSLPNFRVLSLPYTHISGPIDASLQRLQFLSHIRLDLNNLNDSVPEFLANLTDLKVLRLYCCNLQGMFPKRILQILMARRSRFVKQRKPESIGNLELLSRMDISSCNFNGNIPNSIGNLTILVYLDMAYNDFTGHIPLFQNFKDLNLSHNRLSGTIPSTYFEGFVNVVYVDMRFNMFTGKIPLSLYALPSLQNIVLSENQYRGSLANISSVSWFQLDTIDLSRNKLNGSIPLSWFELKGLIDLSLSSNRLTGSLQLETLRRLKNLKYLDLSYNNLLIETSCNSSSETLHP